MPGGGECWINVTAGDPSVVQPLEAKTAVLFPVMRQEGKKVDGRPSAWPGAGESHLHGHNHPSSHPTQLPLSLFTCFNQQHRFLAK